MILGILLLSAHLLNGPGQMDDASQGEIEDELRVSPFAEALSAHGGIWIKEPQASADCIYALRIDAKDGFISRILACKDGRTQLERQEVIRVALDSDSSWSPALGLLAETKSLAQSCSESIYASGLTYAFDASMISGGAEQSLFLSADLGEEKAIFRSGATFPELGKNKSCALIIRRAKQSFHKDNQAMQIAAIACAAQLETASCVKAGTEPEARP